MNRNFIILFVLLSFLIMNSAFAKSPRTANGFVDAVKQAQTNVSISDNSTATQPKKIEPVVVPAEKIQDTQAPPKNQSQTVNSPFKGAKKGEKRKIDISMDNMDLYPVLDLVLSQVLDINYIVDPNIKGTMSFRITGEFNREELLDVFNSILQFHGLAVTKGEHNIYKIVKKGDSPRFSSEISYNANITHGEGDIISIIKVKYLSSVNLANNLRNFTSPGALLLPEQTVNAIILVDTEEVTDKISTIINLIDTDFFQDIHWKIFQLQNTKVDDISKDLDKILQNKGLYGRPGLDTSAFQIIPLKSINSILILTRWDDLLVTVEGWLKEFDKAETGGGSKVYVYFVQNGNAAEIADTLSRLFLGRSSLQSSSKKQVVVKQTSKSSLTDSKTSSTPLRQTTTPSKSSSAGSPSSEISEDVEIIADEVNNAVLIRSKPKDYNIIMDVVKQIDRLPRQVLIEVLIMDVVLKDDLQYGVEWFLKNKGVKFGYTNLNADAALSNGTNIVENTALGKGLAGLSYSLFNSSGALRGLVKVISEKTDVNVLSTPNILAVDNQEASIEITSEVPTLGSVTNLNTENPLQSIDYKNAGIILKVKPSINNSGIVRMEIQQEVSEPLSETTAGINSPTFRSRKANTLIVAKDGETVVIGGLMQTKKTNESDGIPILKDIPILGIPFGSRKIENEKTELLFALTPHVVHNTNQSDAITNEIANDIEVLKQEIEKQKKFKQKISEKSEGNNSNN